MTDREVIATLRMSWLQAMQYFWDQRYTGVTAAHWHEGRLLEFRVPGPETRIVVVDNSVREGETTAGHD